MIYPVDNVIHLSNNPGQATMPSTNDIKLYVFELPILNYFWCEFITIVSGDKPCLGYRSSPGGPYAWLTYNEVGCQFLDPRLKS